MTTITELKRLKFQLEYLPAKIPVMQLQLTKPELEKYITDKVKAGEFPSPEAVVEDAIARAMQGEIVLSQEDLQAIREADAQFERGEVIDFGSFAAQMRNKYCTK